MLEAAAQWIRDDASLAYALGMAGLKLERLPEARSGFERTVAIDPRFYDGWLHLALTCRLLGDTAAREQAMQRAASLPEARDGRVERLRRQFATP